MTGVVKSVRDIGIVAAMILLSGAAGHAQGDLLEACFSVSPELLPAGVEITFDGDCSRSNLGGEVNSFIWDFGDGASGTGSVARHAYASGGDYTVTLYVQDNLGNTASASEVASVLDTILPLEDDFERTGGSFVSGWTTYSGSWSITADGELRGRSSGESLVYGGAPAGLVVGDITVEFDVEFLEAPLDDAGRYAGVFFYNAQPVSRWTTSGYSVSWIDRGKDFGLSLQRWEGGTPEVLAATGATTPDLREPPHTWTITVEGPTIRVYGDGELVIDVEDDRLERKGYFGFWTHSNGQDVLFDNVSVRSGVVPPPVESLIPCARVETESLLAGDVVTLDAGCSQIPEGVEVTAYTWDFGDGTIGSGRTVEHAYSSGGVYSVRLTVEHTGGEPVSIDLPVSVIDATPLPFGATFDATTAPGVDGWTVASGDWSISDDERLEVRTSGTEALIWAGDPPMWFQGDLTLEFRIQFLNHRTLPPADGVGRHAGVFFYSKEPIARRDSESYDVWWIDRDQDFGLGLHAWPLRFLSRGTFDLTPRPPSLWRVEVDGPTIRVFGDDQLLIEVDDDTRRGGYIGFWADGNDQLVRFDTLCIVEGPFAGRPDCSELAPPAPRFFRGDANIDGSRNIADGISVLLALFGSGSIPCGDAMDANDDGGIDISDGVFLLNFLFAMGSEPPEPSAACGVDPTEDDLSCENPGPCA